jgi:hypothetical protein
MIANEPKGSSQRTPGAPDDRQPVDESEHMEVCPRCGQSFDSRILHQVIYHDQLEHKPIALDN